MNIIIFFIKRVLPILALFIISIGGVFFFMKSLIPIPTGSEQKPQVAYQAPIFNVFFHPLIVYPERAFNRSNKHLAYIDNWFVTVKEFKKIMDELYKRGFVLVSPKDLFAEKKDQGKWMMTRKKLILPAGKKPLILSLDDYNFYPTMKRYGTIHRFWVNKQGKLVTITQRDKSSVVMIDDQEVPQLLEKFIATHPDFAYHKARGIISLTGYHGIFGYNTHKLAHQDFHTQVIEAKKVAQKLKAMGWEFASHSYFHLDEKSQSEKAFEVSEKRWLKEVGSIVGFTSYYIFPFGDSWDTNVQRMRFLKHLGYRYFFGVSQESRIRIQHEGVVMGRFPMDGRFLRGRYSSSQVFVNSSEILDSARLAY